MNRHDNAEPSDWVRRFAALIAPGGRVLDLACGQGRHVRYLQSLGYRVAAVDRDAAALGPLRALQDVEVHVADIESGPWPFAPEHFDGIVVTDYLHRPLFPHLVAALREAGVLIYETFAVGNERFGRPSNPHFLLRPGELLASVTPALAVVAFEQGLISTPKPAIVQRICAVKGRDWLALDRPE